VTILRSFRKTLHWLLACALLMPFAPFAARAAPPAATPSMPAKEWQAIQKIIESQLQALKAGDGNKAMAFAAPGISDQFQDPETFMRMIRSGYQPLLHARYTAFLDGAVVGGNTIQPLQLIMPDNTVLVALYQMQKQKNGQWRIAGCVLAPSKVQAT
jgi:hypothetical protein